jgi:ElaA protein
MIHFKWFNFNELTVEQIYSILALRSEVFVVEQNCVYQDPDGQDRFAYHLLGVDEKNTLIAYIRLFPPQNIENYITFARVVTSRKVRSKGYGKKLIEELLSYCSKNFPGTLIKCSAQNHLQKFYESFGFKTVGKTYLEDGIPHIAMER